MKRKWFAVGISTIAVIILILASLNNVVGYQSVRSTVVNDSPLFQTRTQRAINNGDNFFTSNYLGKGLNQLSFPLKDNTTVSVKKIIDRIKTMDDTQFYRFQNLIVLWCDKHQGLNCNDFLHLLNLIKQSSISKENGRSKEDIIKNRLKPPTYIEYTCQGPSCFIMFLLIFLIYIIEESFYLILHLFTIYQCSYGYLQ